MTERATVTQKYQIGLETTPGTTVAASRVLPTVQIDYKPKADLAVIRPVGWKFPLSTYLNREWSEGKISGKPCYNALTYLLAGVLQKVDPTQPDSTGSPSVYQWTMQPALTAEDTVATYTIERGSGVRADRISYGLIPALTLSATRSSTEIGGSIIGQTFADDITMTPSATEVDVVPLLPGHVDVFLDTTFGNIGTTKLLRLLSVELGVADRFAPLWVLDSSQESWVTKIEKAPTVTMKIKMEADATGMSPLAQMRAGSFAYLRLKATGPAIDSSYNYGVVVDMPVKVSQEPSDLADQDGVYAVEWTFHAIYCDACGFAVKSVLTNTLSTL